ncbi:MAG: hypothetical protein AABX59_00835 [Nanoarchaeota archaeon]
MKLNVVKSKHYIRNHERYVPWAAVLRVIFTAKKKRKGRDIFEYKSKSFYVLCKREGDTLKVINAKRIRK